jgi:predicted nucleic-acid-binding protein
VNSIDTNLLVRIVTRDDAKRAALVDALLANPDEPCFVLATVALELESVLRCVFKMKRPALTLAFNNLLRNAALVFEHEGEVESALDALATSRVGFPDALHLALASKAGHLPFVTMDKFASRLPNAEGLGV